MTLDQINAAKDALRAGNATDMSGPQSYSTPAPAGGNQAAFDADWAAANADQDAAQKLATNPGINRLTGQPVQAAPSWDQMTPDQQAATLAKQQQQAADAAQGTQNAKDYWANKPSYTRGLKENSGSVILPAAMIYKTLHRASLQTIQMNEGIGSWLKTKASNMTKSVTADKLQSAWKAAGSPTDSDALAKVLQDSGVSPEIVNSVYTQLQIPAPGTVNTADQLADIQAQIAKLDPASQKELLAYLQK
jgi:hypothetical protein